ncbi:MAG: S8 family serine peptidase, partial [Bacteroidota bacterium]
MKRIKLSIFLLFFIAAFFSIENGIALNIPKDNKESSRKNKNIEYVDGYRVVKGDRPEIILENIPIKAFEKNKLFSKFSPELVRDISSSKNLSQPAGFVKTGITEIDRLNSKYLVHKYVSHLDELYSQAPGEKQYSQRHKAWGFHLWYELSFKKDIDVRSVVKDFLRIEGVDIAEPVYKKRKIKPVESYPVKKKASNKLEPNDPYYDQNQWHFNNTGQDIGQEGIPGIDIQLEDAWDIEMGNENVIVAIMDGGVDFNHEDLADNIWDGIGPDGESTVPDTHGTHVAGTVAAVTNNEVGVAGIAGGSGNGDGVKLMTIDVFDGSISTYNGYVFSADNGVAISQNSWGYQEPGVFNTSDLDGIDYFNENGGGEALNGGGITIFAAGNDNDDGEWYPAYYSGAMAVASHDNRGKRSGFSNYGIWIDITAPGTNIASTDVSSGYTFLSGTSMACPHVSGVAALIISSSYGALTPDELWDALVNNVDDIYTDNPTYSGQLGSGRLNAYKALQDVQYSPNVENIDIEIISPTSIIVKGNVIDEGESEVIERGVVWSTSPNPSIENNEGNVTAGSGTGEFSAQITNLEIDKEYYIRIYATNSLATAYGNELFYEVPYTINFYVVDNNKSPIEGALVEVEDEGEKATGADGEVEFYLLEGDYKYTIESSGFSPSAGSFEIGDENTTLKIILNSESSEIPEVIGEEEVCLGSDVIYNIDADIDGSWEVNGGEFLESSLNHTLINWSEKVDDNYIRYRTIDENDFQTVYILPIS